MLAAQIAKFIDFLTFEKKASNQTIKNYKHYLIKFEQFSGDINVSKINPLLIKKYKLYLARITDPVSKKSLKKLTQNYFLIALRSFLEFLKEKEITSLDSSQVTLSAQEIKPVQVLNEGSLERLLHAPDTTKLEGIRDRTILEVLISTGLRVSEITSLNRLSINLDHRQFSILGKGNKTRVVTLSDSAIFWLNRFLITRKDFFRPLFIRYQGKSDLNEDGEKMRLTPRSIERVVEKYVKLSRLTLKATPQTLRHTLARELLNNGANIRLVQQKMGHSHITTTQMYRNIQDS